MNIEKVLVFSTEDVKTLEHFREHIFHPMCEVMKNKCNECPFNGSCSNIEDFLDYAITNKLLYVGK